MNRREENEIFRLAQKLRSRLVRSGYGGGRCLDASKELVRLLKSAGHDAKNVSGVFVHEVGSSPHHWAEVNGMVLDVTADQFQAVMEGEIPEILFGPYAALTMYRPK